MIRFLLSLAVNAVALWVAVWLLSGMDVSVSPALRLFEDPAANSVIAYAVLGLLFGAVNAVIRPIVAFLSLPITCLTLGLFTVIINAAMLALTSWLSGFLPVQLHIDRFFFTAVFAAVIVSVASLLMSMVTNRIAPARG
jgi:putative membrane protein